MEDSSPLATPPRPSPILFKESISRGLWKLVFILLIVIQCSYLVWLGNGIAVVSDGFSESGAIRAADAFLSEGFTSHYGLPRQAYGKRFLDWGFAKCIIQPDGTVALKERKHLPASYADPNAWVYSHYPPGADLTLASVGYFFGLDRIWLLRLFPLALSLAAVACFFSTLKSVFGRDQAILLAFACLALPAFHTYLPALYFQGYFFALLLFQMSLILRHFWRREVASRGYWVAIFFLGLWQGCLSFDAFFMIGFVAVPFWFLRRAEGVALSKWSLFMSIAVPIAGFGFAHLLHFGQVIAEIGFDSFVAEYSSTAVARIFNADLVPDMLKRPVFAFLLSGPPYVRSLFLAGYQYFRDCLFPPTLQFFPMLILELIGAGCILGFGPLKFTLRRGKNNSEPKALTLAWSERGSAIPTLVMAFLVSFAWLAAMPSHALGNHHFTVHHLFVFYFFLALVIVKSLRIVSGPESKADSTGLGDASKKSYSKSE